MLVLLIFLIAVWTWPSTVPPVQFTRAPELVLNLPIDGGYCLAGFRTPVGVRQAASDARITVAATTAELPIEILAQAKAQDIPENEIHGVLYKGHAYIVRQTPCGCNPASPRLHRVPLPAGVQQKSAKSQQHGSDHPLARVHLSPTDSARQIQTLRNHFKLQVL